MKYAYCQYCGSSTRYDGKKYKCISCKKTFYDNPKAAVVLMLYTSDKKQILLARRSKEPETGKLDFIGGFLDAGETFENAAYREMREESALTNKDIGALKYVTSIYNSYKWEGNEIPTTSVCFIAELKDQANLKAGDDVGSFEFFSIKKLPPKEECAWLDMPRVLKETAQLLVKM